MRFPPIALGIVSLLLAVSAASGADFTRADGGVRRWRPRRKALGQASPAAR